MTKRTEEMNKRMIETRRKNMKLRAAGKLPPSLYAQAKAKHLPVPYKAPPHPEDLPVVMMSNAPRHQEFAEFLVTAWKLYHS